MPTADTEPVCPLSVFKSAPSGRLHSLMVWSLLAEARSLLSDRIASALTGPLTAPPCAHTHVAEHLLPRCEEWGLGLHPPIVAADTPAVAPARAFLRKSRRPLCADPICPTLKTCGASSAACPPAI